MSTTTGALKPSEYDSNEDKLSSEYGLAFARYVDSQHYTNDGYDKAQANYIENEAYRSGTQSNRNVKDYLLNGLDKSFGKLNFTPLNIIPKYVKIIKKNLNIDLFKSKCKAVDQTSVEMRQKERDELVSKMINGQFNENMSKVLGMDFRAKGFIPNSDKDIDVYMETESTLPQEIAIEQAITVVKEANHYQEIQDRIADDVITYGICIEKDDYDPQLGVVVKRVAPQTFITSYDGSEMNDNRSSFYNGHVEMVSLGDLKMRFGMKEEDAITWANSGSMRQEFIEKKSNRNKWADLNSTMVKVLFFEFSTVFTDTYRKKTRKNGKISVDKKDQDFEFNKNNIETFHSNREVWMEGAWIIDSSIMLNYGIRNNMVVDSLKKVRSSYSSYDTNEMPMVRKLIPFADDMNLAIVKWREAIAAAIPKGLAINISSLLDMPNPSGDGGKLSYLALIKRYQETGNMLYRDDEFSAGKGIPITPLQNGITDDIVKYESMYNNAQKAIMDITGVNPTMAGMGAASRVSTDSNEIALQSSIKSIEYIKDAVLSCEKRVSENIVLRLQDIDKYDDKPFKKYVQALGIFNMNALNQLKGLDPFTFSLYIEMLPDTEEVRLFNEDLGLAIQSLSITISQKIAVQNITNLKLAEAVLTRFIDENNKLKQQHELQMAQSSKDAEIMKVQAESQQMETKFGYDSALSNQEFLQEKELLAMKLQMQQNESIAKGMQSFNQEIRGKQSKDEQLVYQQGKMDKRQDKQLEALKDKSLDAQTEKNMKKVKK